MPTVSRQLGSFLRELGRGVSQMVEEVAIAMYLTLGDFPQLSAVQTYLAEPVNKPATPTG